MRQKSDKLYAEILANVRLGILSKEHSDILKQNQLELKKDSSGSCLPDLVRHISDYPSDSVCLFPLNNQCAVINNAMLDKLNHPLVLLKAVDSIEARTAVQKQKAIESLRKLSDKCSKTAGLEDEIRIKLEAKIMLLRNIEVATGLVNGAIGTIVRVHNVMCGGFVEKLTVNFNDIGEREIEPVKTKFPLKGGVYVVRKQFPICLAYAISIHKSQGVTVRNCIVDIGDSIFTAGQVYVALSRVTSLSGLSIINLNPASIKAENSAGVEYNRLRNTYRPDLGDLIVPSSRNEIHSDRNIYSKKQKIQTIEPVESKSKNKKTEKADSLIAGMHGLVNIGNTCWLNGCLQCLFNLRPVFNSVMLQPPNPLKTMFLRYEDPLSGSFETGDLRNHPAILIQFPLGQQHDCSHFLTILFSCFHFLRPIFAFQVTKYDECRCPQPKRTNIQTNLIQVLHLPRHRNCRDIQELIDFNHHPKEMYNVNGTTEICNVCNNAVTTRDSFTDASEVITFSLQLAIGNNQKINNFKISNIPKSTVKINNKTYDFSGAIFHHGQFLRANNNHITAIVRKEDILIRADDRSISKCTWPRSSKDMYIVFYVRR